MPDVVRASIVIATRDREEQLRECLAALAKTRLPQADFEVVVVDDGSRQPPEGVLEPFRAVLPIQLITQTNQGPGLARNAGAARARGELLAFTDDDCQPEPDWLQQLLAAHAGAEAGGMPVLVGGHTRNALVGNDYASASQALIDYLYRYYNEGAGGARFFTSNNMALRRAHFLDIGGFDPQFRRAAGEDRDLSARWIERGWSMVHAPDAVVNHAHHLTARSFWRQHVTYGRGAGRYHALRAALRRAPVKIEGLPFYLGLVGYPIRHRRRYGWPWRRAAGIAALLTITQLANAIGYAQERASLRREEKPGT